VAELGLPDNITFVYSKNEKLKTAKKWCEIRIEVLQVGWNGRKTELRNNDQLNTLREVRTKVAY
jgi:hypothetical protein